LGQLRKRERPLLQDPCSGPINTNKERRKSKGSEQNEEKVLYEVEEQNLTGRYPVFKPVSLSDFQTGVTLLREPDWGQVNSGAAA
jgi:hypothetical protein